ncbi:MAG: selenocysteine-specific translation elongation factor, partial [Armatimonadota bacterium]|nr:selenocysteine-specific translation elongation factor [Armatimonadota bacterium]
MKHSTVGVAGHVDHGKTALVRALTGMETDRLKEEQARGLSIVLGFAHLTLPEGEVDLIDVPGHEKFVKAMIAGATGVDACLLVVAANERVKPQTVEHLALLELLGVQNGLVVVTKSDLAEESQARTDIEVEVREFLDGTFLQDAPLIFASVFTGEGLDALRSHLAALLGCATEAPASADFYLPVDRVFTMAGHGTVVTGTLRRGSLSVGQTVEALPEGTRLEVRGLEVHGRPVARAEPGWRTAVNLRGRKDLARGDALAAPGFLRPTRLLDAQVRVLPTASRPLRWGQTVRLLYGTDELAARVFPLAGNEIAPGAQGSVQFRLMDDAFVPIGERFIVRIPSPAETVGGGVVLDTTSAKHRAGDEAALALLQSLALNDLGGILRGKLDAAGYAGLDLARLARERGLSPAALEDARADEPLIVCDGFALSEACFQDVCVRMREAVGGFHVAHKTRRGMPREELRQKLPAALPGPFFGLALERLVQQKHLEIEDGGLVRVFGSSVEARLSDTERAVASEIEDRFRQGGLAPPNLSDVLGQDRRRKALYLYLVETGRLMPLTDRTNNRTVVFYRDAVAQAERLLAASLPTLGAVGGTVSELNQALGTTRKNSIPLLEYFDAQGVT